MTQNKTYISSFDFHNQKQFAKINKHIDICLTLIEKLIKFNTECRDEVTEKLQIENYIIDYRIDQFGYYDNTLKSIYYSCHSLKFIYDTSTFMNFKGIENTIGDTLENQRTYITFNAIVKLSSMFEYTAKIYNEKIPKGKYIIKLKEKYSEKADSLILLKKFRNTIHSNGKWHPESTLDLKEGLKYKLRTGEIIIKEGEPFLYDHWKIYRIIKDCIELNKLMALDNVAKILRQTKLNVNGQKLAVLKTSMTTDDLNRIFTNT